MVRRRARGGRRESRLWREIDGITIRFLYAHDLRLSQVIIHATASAFSVQASGQTQQRGPCSTSYDTGRTDNISQWQLRSLGGLATRPDIGLRLRQSAYSPHTHNAWHVRPTTNSDERRWRKSSLAYISSSHSCSSSSLPSVSCKISCREGCEPTSMETRSADPLVCRAVRRNDSFPFNSEVN